MLSCDTFALTGAYSSGGRNLLAKNSDRPVGEAQPLIFVPAADHAPGETIRCTQLTIPQVSHSYAVLGSHPFWIWGFEMGANERGLFIGNEAEGSRCPAESEEGLLGMDILRLALERAANAREAIDVIGGLLAAYGQNANANLRYDRRYENSFLLVDDGEIWLLETAGRQWAARQVRDWAAISNCYSIGKDYDLCSPGMESFARERGWLYPEEETDFAKAYTLPAIRQTQALPRFRRAKQLISACRGALNETDIRGILRDHFEGTLLEPRFGAFHADFAGICMHAQDENGAQTAASMLFTRDGALGLSFRYAPSLPCCSVYLPVYWGTELPEALTLGGGKYDARSLWWCAERLAMAVSADEERFGPGVRAALGGLQVRIDGMTSEGEKAAKELLLRGEKEKALLLLEELTASAAELLHKETLRLAEETCARLRAAGGICGPRKEFLESYCRWADMTLA